ncbi:MAG TPA: thermonuclease family protein [Alphaproteobacteria bacterium]|nr:thermonuclease family protein [Alphaproteobacteria bacterium]
MKNRFSPIAALLVALVLAWPSATPAAAAEPAALAPPEGLAPGDPGTVARIVDGDTLVLEDGREVRLVGIQAPKLPLGRPNFRKWPLADEAKGTLADLAMGRSLGLLYGGARKDRHGRVLAHLVRTGDRLWIQGAMLRAGFARVYSFADNRAAVEEMLALERAARKAKRGIWAYRFYAVVPHNRAGRYIGSFQLVEGRVFDTAVIRRWAYVNFAADWRKDFTVSIRRRDLGPFRKAFGRRLERLKGQQIRVRGWLRLRNGPMIEATHPEQIEVLTP